MDITEILVQVITALQQINVSGYRSEELHVDCIRALQQLVTDINTPKEGETEDGR